MRKNLTTTLAVLALSTAIAMNGKPASAGPGEDKTRLQRLADFGTVRAYSIFVPKIAAYCEKLVIKNPELIEAASHWNARNKKILEAVAREWERSGSLSPETKRLADEKADKGFVEQFNEQPDKVFFCRNISGSINKGLFDLDKLPESAAALSRLGISIAPVAAGSPDDEAILSKSDTQTLFALSRSQWEANVAAVVAAGLARATGSPTTGAGLSLKTPEGVVQTLLIYVGSDAKPTKLQVTVEYGRLPAWLMNDAGVEASIAKAKQEMLPEYIVSGDFKRAADGIAVFFTILEAR